MYIPIAQQAEPPSGISISVRAAAGSPALLTKSVAAALGAVNGDITMTFRPLADQVESSLIQERVVALMSGFFGLLALLLAGLGLYGITSYAVNRRRTELGIRMALGAAPGGVVALVLRRVGALVTAGIVVGAAISWMLARLVTTLLFGLQPHEKSRDIQPQLICTRNEVLAFECVCARTAHTTSISRRSRHHDSRKATIGSISVARRAGM